MKMIVCLDNHNAMAFNGRRQSRDKEVIARICSMVGDATLWMGQGSAKLFEGTQVNICISDDYLRSAGSSDFCFAETADVSAYMDCVHEVHIFRWNRDYPYDMQFPADVLEREFRCVESSEFEGYSHPKITVEVYTR